MDDVRIPAAGDPFTSAPLDEHHYGCYRGVVYIGHVVEGDDGEEVEVIEATPCKRCEGR